MKKIPPRSVFAGKHFTTAPPRDGRTVDVYFEKHHNSLSQVRTARCRLLC